MTLTPRGHLATSTDVSGGHNHSGGAASVYWSASLLQDGPPRAIHHVTSVVVENPTQNTTGPLGHLIVWPPDEAALQAGPACLSCCCAPSTQKTAWHTAGAKC